MTKAELENPLINPPPLPCAAPAFNQIQTGHFAPAVRKNIRLAEERIRAICESPEKPTFENTIEALEYSSVELDNIGPIFELYCAVKKSKELEQAVDGISGELNGFYNSLLLNEKLFQRIKSVYDERENLSLDEEQSILLDSYYDSFSRNGALLQSEAEKERLKKIGKDISRMQTLFSSNVTKAKAEQKWVIAEESDLKGVPERVKDIFRANAKEMGLKEEFCILLEPLPNEIWSMCENRNLRESLYRMIANLCTDGPYDNRNVLLDIVRLRHEKVCLLGYASYADYILSNRMLNTPEKVNNFLENNFQVYAPAAEAEMKELRDLAKKKDGIDLKPWDISYYLRILSEQRFNLDGQALRPYFEFGQVLDVLFRHAEKLFDISIIEDKSEKYPVYHSDVKAFDVFDNATQTPLGVFYNDCFARIGTKEGGARNFRLRSKGNINGEEQLPIVLNSCNFERPREGYPTLLSPGEVSVLFHEFGHALNMLLAAGKYPDLNRSCVKGDMNELMSTFLQENAMDPQVIGSYRHYQTGEPIPSHLLNKFQESKHLNPGLNGTFNALDCILDMAYYADINAPNSTIKEIERGIYVRAPFLEKVGQISPRFVHISAGYAAGYHVYEWCSQMEAEIRKLVNDKGLYDPEMRGRLKELYSKSGIVDSEKLYCKVLGIEDLSKCDFNASFIKKGLLPKSPVKRRALRPAKPAPKSYV